VDIATARQLFATKMTEAGFRQADPQPGIVRWVSHDHLTTVRPVYVRSRNGQDITAVAAQIVEADGSVGGTVEI
jgi:hypothetical protein